MKLRWYIQLLLQSHFIYYHLLAWSTFFSNNRDSSIVFPFSQLGMQIMQTGRPVCYKFLSDLQRVTMTYYSYIFYINSYSIFIQRFLITPSHFKLSNFHKTKGSEDWAFVAHLTFGQAVIEMVFFNESANQKQELSIADMFLSDWKDFHRCSTSNINPFPHV